ncbi:MAG: hypothetical protein DID91_2727703352 [Candidatus Nitrotoga sp. MKT]|nr:MAG: hypothetical protein DID91_2727703352 [Candidatus Nitrotoga sp. MKT]
MRCGVDTVAMGGINEYVLDTALWDSHNAWIGRESGG